MSTANEHQTTLFELRQSSRANFGSHNEDAIEHVIPQQLKPVDRGRAAWTVLAAGFVFEALFWGLSSQSSAGDVQH